MTCSLPALRALIFFSNSSRAFSPLVPPSLKRLIRSSNPSGNPSPDSSASAAILSINSAIRSDRASFAFPRLSDRENLSIRSCTPSGQLSGSPQSFERSLNSFLKSSRSGIPYIASIWGFTSWSRSQDVSSAKSPISCMSWEIDSMSTFVISVSVWLFWDPSVIFFAAESREMEILRSGKALSSRCGTEWQWTICPTRNFS